jgi:NitT/TauT family transport system substrate-binding protein
MQHTDTKLPTLAPSRLRRHAASIAAVLLFMVVLGVVAYRVTRQPTTPTPLSIAMNPWPGYEFATLAEHLGYFREEGVDVRLLELSSLGDARRAFERGQADGFFGTITEVLHSREQSTRQAQIILVVDYSDGADVILAAPHIKSVAELRGHRVGIEAGSLNAFVLYRALELSGIAWDEVTTVHVAALDMPAAMAQGKVDAVVAYPPMSLEISQAGAVQQIFTSKDIPGEVVDILAVDASVLRDRKAALQAFCRAFHRAQQYATANPDAAYAVMAARQRITPQEFRQSLQQGIRIVTADQQARYFIPGGKLQKATSDTQRALRLSRQLQQDLDPATVTADLHSN